MILTDQAINECLAQGIIEIEPFNPKNLGSNSYDVTLSKDILVFNPPHEVFDPYTDQSQHWKKVKIDEFGFLMSPNLPVLACTNERTFTPRHVPIITGKSSIGRNFLSIHQTAGFGDIGFNGFWTLELSCVIPTVIYSDMKIGQIYFNTIKGETAVDYSSKESASYLQQKSICQPVPSMLWKKIK